MLPMCCRFDPLGTNNFSGYLLPKGNHRYGAAYLKLKNKKQTKLK
jgi:hypothetical protein